MSLSDHPPGPERIIPAALRREGTAPRSRVERWSMLVILIAISLSVTIPILLLTGLLGRHPRPVQASLPPPAPVAAGSGLLSSLQHSADQLLPGPAALGPDPIVVAVRPDHVAARAEKVRRQAQQFGGTITDGVAQGNEKHLFVDLSAEATAAFRLAVTSNSSVQDGLVAPPPPGSLSAPASMDHVEIIIRPTGDDE